MAISRDCYRRIKKMTRKELTDFLGRQHEDAYNQGVKDISSSISKRIDDGIRNTPGIGEKRYNELIKNIVEALEGEETDAKEHLSVDDRDMGVIGAFLRDMKKPKTNADRIRAMSDEELAELLKKCGCSVCAYTPNKCRDTFDLNCSEGVLEWLKKEVEDE